MLLEACIDAGCVSAIADIKFEFDNRACRSAVLSYGQYKRLVIFLALAATYDLSCNMSGIHLSSTVGGVGCVGTCSNKG